MSQEKQSLKPDVVSSIFSRRIKKRLSSLFIPKGAKVTLGDASRKTANGLPIIKKRFPFGLDIGTNSIKVVQFGCDQGGEIKIIHQIIEELPLTSQTNPKERLHLASEILKKMVNEKGIKGNCFTVAPYGSIKVNLIRLPQMPRGEIDKALRWEIRQAFQVDLNEISLDYIVLDESKLKFLGNQIGILAVTAPKKDIFEHLAFLGSVGLNPLAIDIESLSDLAASDYTKKLNPVRNKTPEASVLPKAGISNGVNPDEAKLFLDFGAGKTSLHVIYNGELISTRQLNVTGNSLTKAISDYRQLSWEEAEEMKKSFGLAASSTEQTINHPIDKAIQVRNALLPLLENMVQDIEHTFKHFSYQVTQSQITRFDKIILSGGSSLLVGFVSFLRNRLNVDVQILETEVLNPRLNVALGLALRGVE